MTAVVVRVGRKGEIYLPKRILESAKLKPGDRVVIRVVNEGRILIEKELSIEDVLGSYVAELSVKEAEELSEEIQRELGIA